MPNETTCPKCGNEQYTSDFDEQGHCSYCGYPKEAKPIHIHTMQDALSNFRNQLAAVTVERDEWKNSSGYYKEEMEQYQKITPDLSVRCHGYLTLLREIEGAREAYVSGAINVHDFIGAIGIHVSRIPAEPAPCQDSQPISPETKCSPEANSGECRGCAGWELDAIRSDTLLENLDDLWERFAPSHRFMPRDFRDGIDEIIYMRDKPNPCPTCAELKAGIVERDRVLDKVHGVADWFYESSSVNSRLMAVLSTRPATDKPEGW